MITNFNVQFSCSVVSDSLRPITVSRNDAEINFDWKRNSPDPTISCDHFQAHWQGSFSCMAGTYTFEIQTDDYAKLIIDGKTIIEDTRKSNSGKMRLAQGQHNIEVFYEEDELEATIALYWSSKNMEKQVMKGFQVGSMLPAMGLNANYSCEQPSICYTQGKDALYAITLDYPESQLVLNIDQPADNMKVTLLGCLKTLPWKYKDGQLFINTTSLKHSDLRSTAAWVFKMK